MLTGIIALLRESIHVTHYTNREIWDWGFYDVGNVTRKTKALTVKLHPHRPRQAEKDPSISEDVQLARMRAHHDTTVIIQGDQELGIQLSDYLFLVNPPAETLLKTNFGTILTGEDYRSKIFVNGIFVDRHGIRDSEGLPYGVDFSKATLDRY